MNVMNKFFKQMINLVMNDGLSLKWFVEHLGISGIKLMNAEIMFRDKYLVVTSSLTK